MSKNNKTALIVGSIIIVGSGLFFYFKAKRKEKGNNTATDSDNTILKAYEDKLESMRPHIDKLNDPSTTEYAKNMTIGGMGTEIESFNKRIGGGYAIKQTSKEPFVYEVVKKS